MMGNQIVMGGGRMASRSIPFTNINHPTVYIGESKENTTLAGLRKGASTVYCVYMPEQTKNDLSNVCPLVTET
jgi:hypothetical protein